MKMTPSCRRRSIRRYSLVIRILDMTMVSEGLSGIAPCDDSETKDRCTAGRTQGIQSLIRAVRLARS